MIPEPSTIALFVVAAVALLVTPGPAVLYIVARSVEQGRWAGLVSALGVHVGTLVHVAAAALGLSALLVSSALAFNVVKYLGAVYLVYLGLRRLLAPAAAAESAAAPPRTLRRLFAQGIVVNILNPKTARSQILGGMVWGIGTALEEESLLDHKLGRFMNHNLAEYHVPVNADVQDIDVIFVEERDDIVNPLGAKGLGEIGVVGVAAAIANAVFHATGKRIRDLPITLDKLL